VNVLNYLGWKFEIYPQRARLLQGDIDLDHATCWSPVSAIVSLVYVCHVFQEQYVLMMGMNMIADILSSGAIDWSVRMARYAHRLTARLCATFIVCRSL